MKKTTDLVMAAHCCLYLDSHTASTTSCQPFTSLELGDQRCLGPVEEVLTLQHMGHSIKQTKNLNEFLRFGGRDH